MTWASLSAFAAATAVLCIAPGPAVLLVLSEALGHGSAKALWSILGIVAGGTAWFALSGTGIGAALLASPKLFLAIKWAGIAYLVWLGVRVFLRKPKPAPIEGAQGAARPAKLFAKGFALQMGNPAVLVFFAAFLPQFLNPRAPLIPQLAILALVSAVIELAVQMGYALFAEPIRSLGPRFVLLSERAAGVMLVAIGLGLASHS